MKEKNRLEIRFAGVGGQGLQAAATILGKSLIISSDKYVCQSQNYGPESRGGLSYSDLIISDNEIDFPKIKIPDVLVCMSNESFLKFKNEIINEEMNHLIVDPEMVYLKDFIKENKNVKVYTISATLTSEEIFNSRIGSNVVLIGAINAILGIGNPDTIKKILSEEWPDLADKNIAAFNRGIELGKVSLRS